MTDLTIKELPGILTELIQQGKRIILVGDKKFKVVDNND